MMNENEYSTRTQPGKSEEHESEIRQNTEEGAKQ